MERGSGLLVHISMLPSKHGIGTFGKEARNFVRFLSKADQKYWQLLPLNPTSYGDSPYQSFSAFALNPYFIDLDYLKRDFKLKQLNLRRSRGGSNPHYVDYGKIYEQRWAALRDAFALYNESEAKALHQVKIEKFYKRNKYWLEDYALFMLLKDMFGGVAYQEWPREYRMHNRHALALAKEQHMNEYEFYIWLQYVATMQYTKLRRFAHRKGIKIIGDMPIYVAADSADVWGNPHLFKLDKKRRPTKVAGVPPDCFSATGQLWGNPIYDYEYCKKTSYRWWRRRIGAMAKYYDLLRIDHFRGFEAYWEVNAGETTAMNGVWVKGPGNDLFDHCQKEMKRVQIIAEDLGVITDEVRKLRDDYSFPGLNVYQFAFEDYAKNLSGDYGEDYNRFKDRLEKHYDDKEEEKMAHLINPFLPHNYIANSVAYIGTHDNDVMDHYIETHPDLKPVMMDYLHIQDEKDISDTLIGSIVRSRSDVVILMLQDVLHLGEYSRINLPGKADGNWQYRFTKDQLNDDLAAHLSAMAKEAGR